MKNAIHKIYYLLGSLFCYICLLWWKLRDFVSKPDNESILFVAHPDDDTLFFHSFIKANKPYVVLLFTGWSIKRLLCFFKVMKYYGVRYRAYPTISASSYSNDRRRKATEQHISDCLNIKSFTLCATHNSEGEYGHPTHKLVHESVVKTADIPILTPVTQDDIADYPLDKKTLDEKLWIFEHLYTSELWTATELSLWMNNEKLVCCEQ